MDATYHLDHLWVYVFSDHTTLRGDVLQHFVEGLSLDLFSFQFSISVVKVEQHSALMEFLDKELWSLCRRGF